MSGPTGIAWTDATWNPVRGCTRVSEGCRNCYPEVISSRFSGPGQPFEGFAGSPRCYSSQAGYMKATGQRFGWTGRVELIPEKLSEPLRWRKPRRVFVNSMSDLFHEDLEPAGALQKVWDVMRRCPQHTFQILTKRAAGMKEAFDTVLSDDPLPNVWLGVSVEDQKTADERIPLLLEVPAAVRFVSYEPALGPVDFRRILLKASDRPETGKPDVTVDPLVGWYGGAKDDERTRIDWLIVGGESGPKARPCDVAWFRSVRDQCLASGTPFFMKQKGALWYDTERREGMKRSCVVSAMAMVSDWQWVSQKDRAGADPSEWPEDLRVREFPEVSRG